MVDNGYIFHSPKHVEYWMTSDGQGFLTKEEAEKWEKIISNPDYHKSYTISSVDILPRTDGD